jgi:D-beta-D-heptose 7-phosphate kinase/D-beta-D-heptose 1-phosphate adenosyltransferase
MAERKTLTRQRARNILSTAARRTVLVTDDTVIGSFTLAIAASASPIETAIFANHAAGVVIGKLGRATVTPRELLASF